MGGDYSWPNVVTLNSVDYVVDGPIITQPAADWAVGIRQGSPTRANVEHVFFKGYESFEGGLGLKFGDAREHPDRFFESQGVRTWESQKEITLAPMATQATLPSAPASALGVAMCVHAIGASDDHILYMGSGDKIWKRANDAAWTEDATHGGGFTVVYDMVEWRVPSNEYNNMMVAHGNTEPYQMLADAAYTKPTSGDGVSAQGWSYEYADSFLAFDDKILKMFFGEIQMSTDGATWLDVVSVPGSNNFRAFFAGVGLNGAGELTPYAVAEGKLFVVDVWTNQREEVDIGMSQSIVDAIVWQDGEIVVTDAATVKAYHPDRPVRDMSFVGSEGPGPGNNGWIRKLYVAQGKYLLAVVERTDEAHTQLFLWFGGAWHNITGDLDGGRFTGCGNGIILYNGFSFFDPRWELFVVTNDSGVVKTYSLRVDGFRNPRLNAAHKYAASGYITTTDFDGGFPEVDGTALEVEIFASALTASDETVAVHYALNGVSGWTSLGTFTNTTTRLKFASGAGIEFQSIRFKFTLSRGATDTKTPVIHSIVFKYLKVPALRRRVSFSINTEQTAKQRDPDTTPEAILDELYALIGATILKTLTWVGEGTYYVKVIAMPRTDMIEARVTPAKIAHIRLECVEPVEA